MNQPSTPDWEARYAAKDMPWEKGAPHPALVRYLERSPLSGRVLVPGCGLGHDVRALAAAGAEPVGWDIAPSAVAAAQAIHPVGAERYELQDLFQPPAEALGAFDAVFEHTCFCAIDPGLREQYVARVGGLLKPGGTLLAIFFVNPDHDEGGPPYGCPLPEFDRLFSAHFCLVHEEKDLPTYPGREHREVLRLLRTRGESQLRSDI